MACKTHEFYLILLLVAVFYTSACAEEGTEEEPVPVDRNSLSSIRLPSKYHIDTTCIICNSAQLTALVIWITKLLLHS